MRYLWLQNKIKMLLIYLKNKKGRRGKTEERALKGKTGRK